jgi:hypothetical protein
MREQIVKTMQERGIKELAMYKSYKEWGKEQEYSEEDYEEDENHDCDYLDYKDQEAPYVVFFDKYGMGSDYRVDKVTLKERESSGPILEFECWANELGYDTFGENDVVFLTLYNVYTTMYDLLEIKDEPEKVWVLHRECVIDYELSSREIKIFRSEEEARKEFKEKAKHDRKDCCTSEWEVGTDDENNFDAYEDGFYAQNHIMIELEETVIN